MDIQEAYVIITDVITDRENAILRAAQLDVPGMEEAAIAVAESYRTHIDEDGLLRYGMLSSEAIDETETALWEIAEEHDHYRPGTEA